MIYYVEKIQGPILVDFFLDLRMFLDVGETTQGAVVAWGVYL